MKRIPLILNCQLFILVSLVIFGCAKKAENLLVENLYHRNSFNRNSLRDGNIAVGGVTSISGQPFGQEHQDRWADLLVNSINIIADDFEVLPSLTVKEALGDSLHYDYLLGYRGYGDLEPHQIRELSQWLGDTIQFLIYSRIDNEEVSQSIHESEDTLKQVKKIFYNTTTTVWITCSIFDLHAQKKVWHSLTKDSGSKTNQYEESTKEVGMVGEMVGKVKTLFGYDEKQVREFPDAVKFIHETESAFYEFVQNLPGGINWEGKDWYKKYRRK